MATFTAVITIVFGLMITHSGALSVPGTGHPAIENTLQHGLSIVENGTQRILDTIGDKLKTGVVTIRDGAKQIGDTLGRLLRATLGKRSAVTLNRIEDLNTVDIAVTYGFKLPLVQHMFMASDVDKNGSLDGQEVLSFIRMIERIANSNVTPSRQQ